ncbi:dTMP kinase [Streptomyces sp. NPDC020898]|uniref:dTMP kinase n=1 Tax=Streptomyces sp. NPDC020898 TaxID=3365101 RepID=UPI0037B3EAE6
MTPYAPTTDDPGFWTLLGPDFAGKSTVLDRLHDDHGWRVVSYDDRYLEQYPLIARLRQRWIDDAFLWAGERYSPELVLSVLHTIVLHLRDQLARSTGPEPVIVDSYFYKLLAKCRLLGLEHDPTFDLWRLFPRPRGVLYLDVPPEVTWARSGQGALLNAFEQRPGTAGRAGFLQLQSELREALLKEVGDVPLTVIDGSADPDTVMADVLASVRTEALR